MFNVQQTISRLAGMSDEQLAQYARMHKEDPYTLALTSSEFKRRQQIRQSGQMQQGGSQPTVADQEVAMMEQGVLPEDQGIGTLPAQNLATMADGGIAGYAEGGPVSFAAGGDARKKENFDPDAYLQNPNVQKFLNYLNVYEGAPKANHLVGFKEFQGFDDHPRTPVVFNKKGAKSDAAGMFQIMSKTWDYQSKKLGLKDFSPENQKRAAIGILKDINALPDIVQGNFDAAKAKAAKQWASLPGSTIGKATGQIARYKPEAEAILEQPVQQAQNQPAPTPAPKEKSLKQRVFDLLPFSSAGAAASPTAKTAGQRYSSYEPIDEDFYARLTAAEEAYEKRFGKPMPVTSRGRTRYEQQKLYDAWKAGKKNIHIPLNPADFPGREVFHVNAVDISTEVPETFLNEFGLKRPLGRKDPVHAVAMKDWKPSAATRMAVDATKTEPKPAPARVTEQAAPSAVIPAQRADVTAQPAPVAQSRVTQPRNQQVVVPAQRADVTAQPAPAAQSRVTQAAPRVQPTPSTYAQNSVGLPSIISSAQAANTPAPPSATTGRSSDFAPENTNVPITYPPAPEVAEYINRLRAYEADQQRRREQEAAKNKPSSKPVPSLKPKTAERAVASDFAPENTNVPITPAPSRANTGYPQVDEYLNQLREFEADQQRRREQEAAQNRNPSKAVPSLKPKTKVDEDAVYDPLTGAQISGGVPHADVKTDSPVTALVTGTADVALGIPEAIANVIAQNYYNLPVGKPYTWKEAREAAEDNPIVKAAGYLRSGKWFGVENDPAYRKDPLSVITALPALGVRGIAKEFNIDEDAAQLALDNALMLAPIIKKGAKGDWQVNYDVPQLKKQPAPTAENIAKLKTEAEAAAAQVEAPRLPAPAPKTAIEVTPESVAKLPEPTGFIPNERAGLWGLAEDQRRAAETARKAREAEAAAAAAAAEAKPSPAAKFLETYPGINRAVNVGPFGIISGGADFSEAAPSAPGASEADVNAQFNAAYKYGDRYVPDAIAEAKKVAEQVTAPPPSTEAPTPASKTFGFSNEDIMTMGLNMMMAQPGQPGGALSQLLGNIGRSGIATLQAKREREKLAQEQAFKDLYGKYIGKQTEVMGRPTGEEAVVANYAKDRGIGFADAYEEISGFKSRAAYIKSYNEQVKDPIKGEAFKAQYPNVEDYLRENGIGGYTISPEAQKAANLYK